VCCRREPAKTLPRRVDLVYKAFLGTEGFLIGEAVYRFEHTGQEYHIMTIGEAKGLAAISCAAREAREPWAHHRHGIAALRVRGRARQQRKARDRAIRLGNRNGDAP
jgi:hypothetical protein